MRADGSLHYALQVALPSHRGSLIHAEIKTRSGYLTFPESCPDQKIGFPSFQSPRPEPESAQILLSRCHLIVG
jgi:hypothetical protein